MVKDNFSLSDDGIIEIVTEGDRPAAVVQANARKIFVLVAKLRAAGKPILILDDVSGMGELPPESHKVFADISKTADYDRFALVGSDTVVRLGANLIAQAIGQPDRLQYFDNHDDAVAWLKAFRPAK